MVPEGKSFSDKHSDVLFNMGGVQKYKKKKMLKTFLLDL